MREPAQVALPPSMAVVEPEPDRRWAVWMPWAVVGAGAAVTGVGGLLYNNASRDYASFDKKFDALCANGCLNGELPGALNDRLSRARTLETVSRISLVVGGATVAAGATLVFLNHLGVPTNERGTRRSFLVPTLGPGEAGIAADISF